MTIHIRLQINSNEWYNYHKRLKEIRNTLVVDPQERIIQRLNQVFDDYFSFRKKIVN